VSQNGQKKNDFKNPLSLITAYDCRKKQKAWRIYSLGYANMELLNSAIYLEFKNMDDLKRGCTIQAIKGIWLRQFLNLLSSEEPFFNTASFIHFAKMNHLFPGHYF